MFITLLILPALWMRLLHTNLTRPHFFQIWTLSLTSWRNPFRRAGNCVKTYLENKLRKPTADDTNCNYRDKESWMVKLINDAQNCASKNSTCCTFILTVRHFNSWLCSFSGSPQSTLHFRLLCSKQAVYTQKSIIRRRHCPNIPDLTASPFLIIFKLIKMNDKIKNLQFWIEHEGKSSGVWYLQLLILTDNPVGATKSYL